MADKIKRYLPQIWLPDARMKRVIVHWTAGAHRANNLDLNHYHFIVEGDGRVVRGHHSVRDNQSPIDNNRYAAHTKNCNGGSIGVAVACMHGATERPFDAGAYPMTKVQWYVMAHVVAELCYRYHIQVQPECVLGHGEVQKILGIRQDNKWDPTVLPWNPTLSAREVGDTFRKMVRHNKLALMGLE